MKSTNIINLHQHEVFDTLNDATSMQQSGTARSETLASRCNATVLKLHGYWPELLNDLSYLGPVGISTHNENARLEINACYRVAGQAPVHTEDDLPSPLDTKIISRVNRWHECYAVREKTITGIRHRIRIYDRDRREVHSITLLEQTDHDAWSALTELYSYKCPAHDERQVMETAVTLLQPPFEDVLALGTGEDESIEKPLADTNTDSPTAASFHGFNHLFNASMICHEKLLEVFSFVAEWQVPVSVTVVNSNLVHETELVFDRLFGLNDVIKMKGREASLSVTLSANTTCWLITGTLRGVSVTSIEIHDAYGNLIARLSMPEEKFRVLMKTTMDGVVS